MVLPAQATRARRDLRTPPLTRRSWLMLAVLLLGQFMCIIDVFVVNVAMPSIAAHLHASGASLQLVVGGYTIAYAMLLITGARLGDRFGRRRTYLAGVITFTAASLACALARQPVLWLRRPGASPPSRQAPPSPWSSCSSSGGRRPAAAIHC